MRIDIVVNGEAASTQEGQTVEGLLAELGLDPGGPVSVAINDQYVPYTTWSARSVEPDDRIIILTIAQGG